MFIHKKSSNLNKFKMPVVKNVVAKPVAVEAPKPKKRERKEKVEKIDEE